MDSSDDPMKSVKRMDDFRTNEMGNLDPNFNHSTLDSSVVGTRGSLSTSLEADIEGQISSHQPTPENITETEPFKAKTQLTTVTNLISFASASSFPQCTVDPHVLKKAATDMLEARNYIMQALQNEFHPFLMKNIIVRALTSQNVQFVKSAIKSTVQTLDFRALDWIISCADVPQRLEIAPIRSCTSLEIMTSEISMPGMNTGTPAWSTSIDDLRSFTPSRPTKLFNFPSKYFTPPNEFDWFSRDKMGEILSFSQACDLFSTIKIADCAKQLKQLYMNAKRANDLASSEETLPAVIGTLADLKLLTKLVLRGMCDDDMLKIIGQNMFHIEHLDVSGSQYVTDTGIQHLFFQEPNHHCALFLVSAWILKNMDRMNPCTHSLIYFDYSWTCVSSTGRKMVQLLPGSYLFKRLMCYSQEQEYNSFGHHIFIREAPCMQELIPTKVDTAPCKVFEKHLIQHVGLRGVKRFLKIVEHHPWKNCILNLYTFNNGNVLTNMTSYFGDLPNHNKQLSKSKHCFGIITPNQSEKRIQGIVNWIDGALTQVYSIYPVNINTIGMLGQLRLLRGIVNEVWRMQCSLLPDLVHLDIFAEPTTVVNIIQSCPSLRRLRVLIRRNSITDDQLIKAVDSSMCKRTLEDIWIAPGKLIEDDNANNNTVENTEKSVMGADSCITERNDSNVSSTNRFSQKTSSEVKMSFSYSAFQALELVQLSLDCVDALVKACPKLKRLGDLSTWTKVEAEELYVYCEQLKIKNSKILIIWANMNLPNYGKKAQEKQKRIII